MGIGPFNYQWQFKGDDLSNETGASLVITNTQLANEGPYTVRIGNSYGVVTSEPVSLRVLITPSVLVPPLSQSVVEGGNGLTDFILAVHGDSSSQIAGSKFGQTRSELLDGIAHARSQIDQPHKREDLAPLRDDVPHHLTDFSIRIDRREPPNPADPRGQKHDSQ